MIGNCSECLIQNKVLTDNGQSGIYVGGNGSLAARVTIEGNSVSYNWNRGIDLGLQITRSGSNNVIGALVVGNLAYNNHENNFWLAGVADSTVTGNTAIYDAGYKSWPGFGAYPGTHINIGLYDGAAGDALVGCTITGNTTTDNLGKVGISFSYAITPPHGCIISGNTVDSAYYIYGKAAYINNRVDVVSSR